MQRKKKYGFWTDQIAERITERRRFHYTEDRMPKFKKFVVKTSASLSGVLHIGRLSDTIRGEAVHRSLKDLGVNSELIWVAEDMDPLRKVPKGVPENYIDFIGMPVTDIPDPHGCHKSYAEHHVSEYFKVLDQFIATKMKKFSMREEYKKGNFKKYIKILLRNVDMLIEIQNKYRMNKISEGWSPWKPICDNCGKIITTKVSKFEKGKVHYKCLDYKFEKYLAKGCGYEGENDPLKGNGKLLWKGEWAAEWARWKVCSEGAGKEYQVPGSAFWINGEIAEKILKFPEPVPIFYEHLVIDGKKMSASLGNIVYPHDWLKVSTPELLRLLFLKDPMRERNFRWTDIANMMDENDRLERVYYKVEKVEDERDRTNFRRLFEQMQIGHLPKKYFYTPPFSIFLEIVKILPEKNQLEFTVGKLKEFGHLKDRSKQAMERIEQRLQLAENWYEKYGRVKGEAVLEIEERMKVAVRELIELIERERDGEKIQQGIFSIVEEHKIKPSEFFKLVYKIILNSERGPRLGQYIIERGKEEIIEKLKEKL